MTGMDAVVSIRVLNVQVVRVRVLDAAHRGDRSVSSNLPSSV